MRKSLISNAQNIIHGGSNSRSGTQEFTAAGRQQMPNTYSNPILQQSPSTSNQKFQQQPGSPQTDEYKAYRSLSMAPTTEIGRNH